VAEEPVALDRSVTAAFTIRDLERRGLEDTLTSVSVTSTLPTLHVHGAGGGALGRRRGRRAPAALGRPARSGRGGASRGRTSNGGAVESDALHARLAGRHVERPRRRPSRRRQAECGLLPAGHFTARSRSASRAAQHGIGPGLGPRAVKVPGGEEPALAWRRLRTSTSRRSTWRPCRRRVQRVALDGATVLVRPRDAPPLPLLAGRPSAAGGTPPAPPPEGAPPAPWTWSVGKVDVTDTLVKVFLEPPPLEIRIVKAAVTDLSSATGSSATIALELREGEGTIAVDGTGRPRPARRAF